MNSYKKQFILNISIGFLTIIFLIIGIFYFANNFKKNINEVASARQEILGKTLNLSSFASIKNIYETKVKNNLELLEKYLFTKNDFDKFLNDVQLIASKLNLESFNITFLTNKEDELEKFNFQQNRNKVNNNLNSIVYNINLTSNFDKFLLFLESFEKTKYLKDIELVNFNEKENNKFIFLIQGRLYYRN